METRQCQNCKVDFKIEKEDFVFYEKIKVPPPTFCPECRFQRRMAWRNDTSLYNRTCELCKKGVISMYSPDSEIIVYCNKCWWSDNWDPYSYGIDYDFTKPFFTQYMDLVRKVPHIALVNDNGIASTGCEYTGDCWFAKNCYMTFCAWKIENVMYSNFILGGKDIMDSLTTLDTSDWIYECISCEKCYKVRNSQICISCVDSYFLYDCRNCTDCFMCGGLRNKRYCFKNVQYSKEEYEKILASYKLDTFSGVETAQKEYDEFILTIPRRYAQIFQSINCVGDIMSNSKNCKNCFISNNSENSKFIQMGGKNIDSYDLVTTGEQSECYEGVVVDHSSRNFFGLFSVKSQDIEYTMHCHGTKSLFGCVGLKKGEYSILNKRYTKDEYKKIVEKIRQQMMDMPYVDALGNEYRYGEYFPIELSHFGYNETTAPQVFPLSEEDAEKKNYKWQNNIQKTTDKQTIESTVISESIKDIPDSFTEEILECMECKRNYKIIDEELHFYKKMNIPIPRFCYYCRYDKRLSRRNPFKLWHRNCMNKGCPNEFETSYAPERPEIIYCESCYNKEIN